MRLFDAGDICKNAARFCFIVMITLQPISTAQSLTVYIRHECPSYKVVITDEQTNVETELTPTSVVYGDGQLTFQIEYDFAESRFYWLNVVSNDIAELNVNKSKIYTTTQTDLQKYSMSIEYFDEIEKTKSKFYVKD